MFLELKIWQKAAQKLENVFRIEKYEVSEYKKAEIWIKKCDEQLKSTIQNKLIAIYSTAAKQGDAEDQFNLAICILQRRRDKSQLSRGSKSL
jgi:hypothetical protein